MPTLPAEIFEKKSDLGEGAKSTVTYWPLVWNQGVAVSGLGLE